MFHRLRSEVFQVSFNGQARAVSWNEIGGLSIPNVSHAEAVAIVTLLQELHPRHVDQIAGKIQPQGEPDGPAAPPEPEKAADGPSPEPYLEQPPVAAPEPAAPEKAAEAPEPVHEYRAGGAAPTILSGDGASLADLQARAARVAEPEARPEQQERYAPPVTEQEEPRRAVPRRPAEPQPQTPEANVGNLIGAVPDTPTDEEAAEKWEPLAEPEDEPIQDPDEPAAVDAEPVDMWDGVEIEKREDLGSYQKLTLVNGDKVKIEKAGDEFVETARVLADGTVVHKAKPAVKAEDVKPPMLVPSDVVVPEREDIPEKTLEASFLEIMVWGVQEHGVGVKERNADGKPTKVSASEVKAWMSAMGAKHGLSCMAGVDIDSYGLRISRGIEFLLNAEEAA